MCTIKGKHIEITSIEKERREKGKAVYNFVVEDWESYFVSEIGIYVHNDRCKPPNRNGEIIENDILGKPRTGSALKVDEVKPIYKIDPKTGKPYMAQEFPAGAQAHGFNDIVDNYAGYATKSPIPNGELYQLEGALNGVDGRFEWIVQDGNVTHRMFIQNGTMNGVPIKP